MRRGVITIVLIGLAIGGCSSAALSSECLPPCEGATSCEVDPRCAVETGASCSHVCVGACVENACPEGRRCQAIGRLEVCGRRCETAFCGKGRACTGPDGTCVTVGCTSDAACLDGVEFCDPSTHRCLRLDGACTDVSQCAVPPSAYRDALTGVCVGGYCSAKSKALVPVDASAPTTLRPMFGKDYVVSTDSFALAWEPAADPIMLFVSRRAPSNLYRVGADAFWAATAAPWATTVAWSSGVDVVDGVWRTGSPRPPPVGEPLYLTLATVRRGELTALSLPTLFAFGAFRADGGPCTDEGVLDGQCVFPGSPRWCRAGRCTIVCHSNPDCDRVKLLCGHSDPTSGLRWCGAP